MSRHFLWAYLKAQEAHKELHRLTKSFEEDLPDAVLEERLTRIEALLSEVRSLVRKSR